jgi:hypothetical protein
LVREVRIDLFAGIAADVLHEDETSSMLEPQLA